MITPYMSSVTSVEMETKEPGSSIKHVRGIQHATATAQPAPIPVHRERKRPDSPSLIVAPWPATRDLGSFPSRKVCAWNTNLAGGGQSWPLPLRVPPRIVETICGGLGVPLRTRAPGRRSTLAASHGRRAFPTCTIRGRGPFGGPVRLRPSGRGTGMRPSGGPHRRISQHGKEEGAIMR